LTWLVLISEDAQSKANYEDFMSCRKVCDARIEAEPDILYGLLRNHVEHLRRDECIISLRARENILGSEREIYPRTSARQGASSSRFTSSGRNDACFSKGSIPWNHMKGVARFVATPIFFSCCSEKMLCSLRASTILPAEMGPMPGTRRSSS